MRRWLVTVVLAAGCSFDRGGAAGSRDGAPPPGDGGTVDATAEGDASGPCMTGALDFSPDSWVEVADDSLDLTDDFAVMAWVRPREVGGEQQIISHHDDGASEGYVLMIKDMKPEFRVYFPDDSGPPSRCECQMDGVEVEPDVWVHLAGSYSGNTSYLFKNGVLVDICDCPDLCGACTGAAAPYDGAMTIGIEASRLDRFAVDGLIDDVHVIGSPLTASFDPVQSAACATDSLALFRFEPPVAQDMTSGCGTGVSGRLGSESGADLNDPTAVETECPAL